MREFLLALGALSLGGAVGILLLALVGRSTRLRYASRWRCWAWALLLVRMALPIPVPESVPVQAPIQLTVPSDAAVDNAPAPLPDPGPDPSPQTPPSLPDQTLPAPDRSPVHKEDMPPSAPSLPAAPAPAPAQPADGTFTFPTLSLIQILFFLWLAGALAGMALALVRHLRFLRWLRRWGSPAEDPETIRSFNALGDALGLSRRPALTICPGLKGPMLAGLVRPVLLLPDQPLDPQDLYNGLLHELVHFRRRDIWLKTLALLVNALYWFHPLCWYMVRLVERDTELACDEEALRTLPREERAAYGRTILNAADRS